MNRTLMARNPTAMTRTTSRSGTRPSLSVAAKAVQVKDSALSAKARVKPEANAAETISAGPFRALGRNSPVAIAMCFFSLAVTAAAMKVAARTRCSTQTPEFLKPVWRTRLATSSTRSRTARAKMDKNARESSARRTTRTGLLATGLTVLLRPLPQPFFVIATQNPVNQSGTYPLPESQLDRFLMRLELGYPHPAAERQMFERRHSATMEIRNPRQCITMEQLEMIRVAVSQVLASDNLIDYLQRLVAYTRQSPEFEVGLSPRGALALLDCAKTWAAMHNRSHVVPEVSEAVEVAAQAKDTNYSLGSVLNHVLLHQSVIGLEAMEQMAMAGDQPDVLIGCTGGGSNFGGIAFPFVGPKLRGEGYEKLRVIAVEPAACPSLTAASTPTTLAIRRI